MATLMTDPNLIKKKEEETPSGTQVTRQSGVVAGGPTDVTAPKQQGSGRFTNLQTLKQANQGAANQIAGRVTGGVTNQANQFTAGVQKQADEYKNVGERVRNQAAGMQEAISKASAMGSNIDSGTASNLVSSLNQSSQATQGINDLGDVQQKQQALLQKQANLSTGAGQQRVLRDLFSGRGQLGKGQMAVDQALLGTQDLSGARRAALSASQQGGRLVAETQKQAAQDAALVNEQLAQKGAVAQKLTSQLGQVGGISKAQKEADIKALEVAFENPQYIGEPEKLLEIASRLGIDTNSAVGLSTKEDLVSALSGMREQLKQSKNEQFLGEDQRKALDALSGGLLNQQTRTQAADLGKATFNSRQDVGGMTRATAEANEVANLSQGLAPELQGATTFAELDAKKAAFADMMNRINLGMGNSNVPTEDFGDPLQDKINAAKKRVSSTYSGQNRTLADYFRGIR